MNADCDFGIYELPEEWRDEFPQWPMNDEPQAPRWITPARVVAVDRQEKRDTSGFVIEHLIRLVCLGVEQPIPVRRIRTAKRRYHSPVERRSTWTVRPARYLWLRKVERERTWSEQPSEEIPGAWMEHQRRVDEAEREIVAWLDAHR